ncbi:MAG: flagellar hook assembly protein FlgD [Cryobacterium sp.]|nr:flagellar hook assembly protein FlgD [Oligoflexia bacterium]
MNTKGPQALTGKSAVQAQEPLASPGGSEGVLNQAKDSKDAQTDAHFGDLWKQIQTKYGAKPDKPREIKKTLGKDDFLKIMITQMKNQDPTSPFKAEEMATQMAQFASVEQLQNLNSSVGKMANSNQPLERLAMTNLIGKTVTIDRERFTHNENETSSLGFGLARDAKSTKIKIVSEQGETILEKDLGEYKAGAQTFVWDGAKTNGMPVKSGNFIFKIEAVDANDRAIAMDSKGQSKVVGVAFDGPEGTLLVGDANSPQKITMRNVIRIDSTEEGAAAAIPGARSMASALQLQGVPMASAAASQMNAASRGTSPGLAMGTEARKALDAYEAAKASDGKNSAVQKSEKSAEKGFPNGISSEDTI